MTVTPAAGAVAVNPGAPVSVDVRDGTVAAVALTADDGRPVPGSLSPDGRRWTAAEPLGYGRGYTWSGTATGADGAPVPVAGAFRTFTPARTMAARFARADDTQLGVAAPVELTFDGTVTDRAAVERALQVRLTMPQEGAWAWLPDTAEGSRIHFRPREYWRSGQVIDVRANLAGVDLGGGTFGVATITNRLVIARTQITRADMTTRRLTVVRDGRTVMDVPASFGTDTDPNLLTRGGTHVVSAKEPFTYMSNPRYNYVNVYVRWAVRLNNNGEFTHHNPATANAVGQRNVTHGCINMSDADARAFYDSTYLGDPVEVVGSPIPLSAQDGDIYDWTIPWDRWKTMSALV